MDNIKFHEVSAEYVDYLAPHAPHLFRNKKDGQQNERKCIGVVFQINDLNYFAPLSSFKLYVNTNYLRVINDMTIFSSNRVHIIPFDRHFEEWSRTRL